MARGRSWRNPEWFEYFPEEFTLNKSFLISISDDIFCQIFDISWHNIKFFQSLIRDPRTKIGLSRTSDKTNKIWESVLGPGDSWIPVLDNNQKLLYENLLLDFGDKKWQNLARIPFHEEKIEHRSIFDVQNCCQDGFRYFQDTGHGSLYPGINGPPIFVLVVERDFSNSLSGTDRA